MWIGTLSGLNRFDGYHFRTYRNSVRDSTSLSHNDIRKLAEDPNGRIWVITNFSTCIYDPEKDIFHRNTSAFLREFSIPPGIISSIMKDKAGNFWFVHDAKGLFMYDPAEKTSRHLISHEEKKSTISSFMQDSAGNYWILYRNGVIEKMNGNGYNIIYRNDVFRRLYPHETPVYEAVVDLDNDLWVYLPDYNRGVYCLNAAKDSLVHFTTRSKAGVALNNNIVHGLATDDNGLIWIATDHGGVNIIDKKRSTVKYVLNDPEDDKSLSQNSLNSIYKDSEGIIWLGTYKKGLSYYHSDMNKFKRYYHQRLNSNSLPYGDINSFAEDDQGNLWIGTNGGGLIFMDRRSNTFRQYLHDPGDPNSLSNNVIVSLFIDHDKDLWIGTYYGGLDRFDGKKFTHYRYDPQNANSLSDDNVWEILEDSRHNLWIGTLKGGLTVFNPESHQFTRYRNPNGVSSDYVPALMEDKEGNVWIGTGYGVSVYNVSSDAFTKIIGDGSEGNLSNNNVLAFYNDSRGYIWVGTQEGLNLYDRNKKTFRVFRQEDGLPHNTILSILEDNSGNLWFSTPYGISNLILNDDPGKDSFVPVFKNYDELDGLQGKQFNESAALKTRDGELIFGGPNGFNLFRPEEILLNRKKPPVALIDFQIYNNSVPIGKELNGKIILPRSITSTKAVTLRPGDNVFSIEFAALSFLHPEKNRYRYRLEGFNREWLHADGSSRKVTYTNLDPGDYTFRVIASNNDGYWNEEGAQLKITVLPPFWKTNWAFMLYASLILGALFLSRRLILERERMRFRIEQERQEASRVHELDMMKIKFFTNISHEFRTPLSLILTPAERLLDKTKDPAEKVQFQMIYRNARRLLNLVNQLLDFRKMEEQQLKLNASEGDVVKFIDDVVLSFSDISEKKNIRLAFRPSVSKLETFFDQDKLEKILFNLLSNAFKFTPEGGSVTVETNLISENDKTKWLEIKVADTGIGIPADKQDKVFERFFQNDLPRSMVNQGSGIGLSITREFVRLHGGKITVESLPDKGSCFRVLIPVSEITGAVTVPPVVEEEIDIASAEPTPQEKNGSARGGRKKPVILLAEDNEDFRFYLKDNLKVYYHVMEARDGVEGWNKVQEHIPDLIVTDVMMPEMNGMELCRKVKSDARTSHIPVILLTARTAADQKLEGYDAGADDYVTKPFNFEILLSRIKNLISLRASLHKSFNRKIDVKASEIQIASLDETLIKNAVKLVEDKLGDPDFSVEDLSRELGMSRVHLYKKLLALTGKSPLEFIRTLRLQRAAQLLDKSQLTVAEIAYKVGFNNPKYFAKYFKEEFKMLPSNYAARRKD